MMVLSDVFEFLSRIWGAIDVEYFKWIGLLFSSTLLAAIVNAFVNIKMQSKQHEKDREKDEKQINHVLLGIAFDLERFAKNVKKRVFDIDDSIHEMHVIHDYSALKNIPNWIEFDYGSVANWELVSIDVTARLNRFRDEVMEYREWIIGYYNSVGDIEDAYKKEQEVLIFMGYKALVIALEIYATLKLSAGHVNAIKKHFRYFNASVEKIEVQEEIVLPDFCLEVIEQRKLSGGFI